MTYKRSDRNGEIPRVFTVLKLTIKVQKDKLQMRILPGNLVLG